MKTFRMLQSTESIFVVLAVLTILITNFEKCLTASFNIDEYLRHRNQDTECNFAKEVCETPGCIHTASLILDSMDPSVDPCSDFYRFACGKFIKESVIPDDKSKMDTFDKINDQIQQQLRISIEDDLRNDSPRAFKLLQSYYNTCMNTTQIEATSEHDFRAILNNLGGWPVLDGKSWNESAFDWKKSVVQFRNTGYSINYFIDFEINVDMKNNSRRLIDLDQASTALPQEYLSKGLEDKVVQAYFKYMIDLAEIFGANRDVAKKELADSLNFEIELAKISLASDERRDMTKLYNPMSVAELQKAFKSVLWIDYINNLLAPHTKVEPSEQVNVVVPSFFQSFSKLIVKTPKRVLANYAMWRMVAESAPRLGERVQKAEAEFSASLTGTNVKEPRWKECLTYVSNKLYIAVGALYVRRYFDKTAKDNAVDIIHNIRKSYERILTQVDWMDEETRKAALEKLDWIQPHIGYPNEFLDDTKLDEYYQYLKIYSKSFLKSHLSLNLFQLAYDFEQLRKPVNKTEWITHGQTAIVNAYYEPTENSIQFPAGILQGKFFTKDRPKYMNYGAVGFVMGHEMTHGFDDQGRQFDKEGNLIEWWEPETKKKYLERAQCIIDQYSNYTVKEVGLKINGKNTQGENIADNGGIKEAYFAYNEWEKQNGQEPRLPGLYFTSQQMFWISAANVWCNKYRPEALKARIVTDVHSPGEFRVIGPMSNMQEFSNDFQCPLGSPMNPVKKCTVW
ncbi:neprilysin-2-like [Phymastichus coffea]|uniref:neprilysin-2-like n=1 Tax=Phymastichus coffea TaxID=108790 RepID=UPI00273BA357|nr:neprilysin-2-like [Phymastichus coffea]XP_058798011.1 neprilysin-2-like [Phymastichus coffea]XP_058798012.1 neprilysin-2-like [Phymastichus coffea]XP_058798013.1 neprilysin-2-like [Phymastichus coffea]XP_058798014.1 neprilysin-2-like [Phymastichus coffea]XP_058809599.1 neprilysin-2-like [Phymastichus coffea]XP_058809600.1 neprilysin-2-like [Phymastichus coffea]XP_058809601.1 neprilysin-2-like [Phymastichus coffea]XP_058809602.1 neprilysin-2-like [Phymastichus coffea]XP_058809603.1 nepri